MEITPDLYRMPSDLEAHYTPPQLAGIYKTMREFLIDQATNTVTVTFPGLSITDKIKCTAKLRSVVSEKTSKFSGVDDPAADVKDGVIFAAKHKLAANKSFTSASLTKGKAWKLFGKYKSYESTPR